MQGLWKTVVAHKGANLFTDPLLIDQSHVLGQNTLTPDEVHNVFSEYGFDD